MNISLFYFTIIQEYSCSSIYSFTAQIILVILWEKASASLGVCRPGGHYFQRGKPGHGLVSQNADDNGTSVPNKKCAFARSTRSSQFRWTSTPAQDSFWPLRYAVEYAGQLQTLGDYMRLPHAVSRRYGCSSTQLVVAPRLRARQRRACAVLCSGSSDAAAA